MRNTTRPDQKRGQVSRSNTADRGQASITLLETGVALLLILGILFTFSLGVPDGETERTQAQLDVYASDAATLLSNEPPRHREQTRLAEVTESPETFDREKDELERRVERILPDNLMFRVETAHGTVGHPLPANVPTGEATVLTVNGEVTLRVWYV